MPLKPLTAEREAARRQEPPGQAASPSGQSLGGPGRGGRAQCRDWLFALLLLAAAAAVYLASPIITSNDSYFSMQVTASLYAGDWGELSDYRPIFEQRQAVGQRTYQIMEVDGRIFSFYPVGAPLMAVPLMAVMDGLDPTFVKDLRHNLAHAVEQRFAALLSALAPALLFLALRGRGFGLAVALAGAVTLAFSTTLWSQASRALWQHGPLLVCYGGLLWALAAPAPGRRRWFAAGLCGGFAYLVRPSALLAAAPFGLLALRQGFGRAAAYGTGLAIGIGAAALYNHWAFGSVVPLYASALRPDLATIPEAFAGLLVSPSRGLLVFTPALLLAGFGLLWASRRRHLAGLDWAILAAGLLQFALLCVWRIWDGGHSYGPRLQTDLLPFALWFLCFGLQAGTALAPAARRQLWRGFALLFAIGFVIHLRGATDSAVYWWNASPEDPILERVWDWSDPQFLRGW
jgi:hypothetical protein